MDSTKLVLEDCTVFPLFVSRGFYEDQPFTCQECGKEQVWTATQQKWWYEVAKGNIWTTARLCRPCRRRERERKNNARRIHQEGLARKQSAANGQVNHRKGVQEQNSREIED